MKMFNIDGLAIGRSSKYFFEKIDGKKKSRRLGGAVALLAYEREVSTGLTTLRVKIYTVRKRSEVVRGVPLALAYDGRRFVDLLVNRGLYVKDLKAMREIVASLHELSRPKKHIDIADGCGWFQGAQNADCIFVDGMRAIKLSDGKWIHTRGGMNSGFALKGTLAEWNKKVGSLARGNPVLQLAICAALAAPLLHFLGHDNFGLQIVGTSRMGKTNSLRVAASVYGEPQSFKTWNATPGALAWQAHARNDVPLLLDELGEANIDDVMKAVYQLGNGTGRSRLNRGLTVSEPENFRTVVIATGEKSLAELAADKGRKLMMGQVVRLIPLSIKNGTGVFEELHGRESSAEFVRVLKQRCAKTFGTLGAAWIARLAEDPTVLKGQLGKRVRGCSKLILAAAKIDEPTGLEDSVALSMAVCAAAGEHAIAEGLLKWKEGEAASAMAECFFRWRSQQLQREAEESEAALSALKHFLQSKSDGRFVSLRKFGSAPRDDLAGARHEIDGRRVFLLLPAYFNSVVGKAGSPKDVLKLLRDRKLLVTDSGQRYTKQVRAPGDKTSKLSFYAIAEDILAS